MKLNRFTALAAITLLVVGAMGFTGMKAFAQATQPTAQAPDRSADQVDGAAEVQSAGPDSEAPGSADTDVQEPSYAGSIAVDQAQTEGMSEADEAAALQGKATISATDAEAAALAANSGATVAKTELDNENGALVYSVELSNSADVKVDAGNGSILFTDSGADSEG